MAWDTTGNTWSTPGTSWSGWSQDELWKQFTAANPNYGSMNGAQKAKAFLNWWNTSGSGAWRNSWQAAYDPWQETYQGWLNDPDRYASFTQAMPSTPDFSGLGTWKEGQLYGTEDNPNTTEDESKQGIYGLMSQLAAELAGGSEQYSDEWLQAYASQAGFDTPEAREQWLQTQRANQDTLQAKLLAQVENPTQITAEQQKQIRAMQAEQEASARKQAEAMYQETGSYAVLQRASDELNRAAVSDALKSQMDMALQNYSTTLSAVNQQTETLMREVEAGTQSFQYYVQAKQQGISSALAAYQSQAETILRDYEQQFGAMQTAYGNDMEQYQQAYTEWQDAQTALNAQGDLIMQAATLAMGGTVNMYEAMEQYYSSVIQPMLDEFTLDTDIETTAGDATGASIQAAASIFGIVLGGILMFVPGGQVAGAALVGTGLTGLGTTDWGALAAGTSTNTQPEETAVGG